MTTGAAATTGAVVVTCEPPCPAELQCVLLEGGSQAQCASPSVHSLQQQVRGRATTDTHTHTHTHTRRCGLVLSLSIIQLSVLLAEPASGNLTAFTESLASAAGSVMRPEDIPVLIDLFVQSLEAPMAGLELSAYEASLSLRKGY